MLLYTQCSHKATNLSGKHGGTGMFCRPAVVTPPNYAARFPAHGEIGEFSCSFGDQHAQSAMDEAYLGKTILMIIATSLPGKSNQMGQFCAIAFWGTRRGLQKLPGVRILQ